MWAVNYLCFAGISHHMSYYAKLAKTTPLSIITFYCIRLFVVSHHFNTSLIRTRTELKIFNLNLNI